MPRPRISAGPISILEGRVIVEPNQQLDAALTMLARLGIEVREAHLGGQSGGLCMIRGRRVVFVDLDADAATQLERYVAALADLPELDQIYIPPALREPIERAKG